MNKLKECIKAKKVAIISLLVALILSLFVLYTPTIVSSADETQFSGVRAAAHIGEISKEPHSYYDQVELETVRLYLEDTLTSYLGAANVSRTEYSLAQIKDTIDEDLPYPLINIVGKIQGETDSGIVIMAHYDSRGHIGRFGELGKSYGAMDDGYGVGTMLELAFILKDLNPKNSIYFLFTDAEEVGLYGATMASKDNSFMQNVKFVINLEARGRYGPSYMFETSKNNANVIDLYKKANFPVTYSMATAVYSVMPNYTDFTPFVEAGVPGLNFANLAGLENYHTPLDTYELISIETIQHLGTQIEPVIREFASDSKYVEPNYFESTNDQVFFTLFANVLVSYRHVVAIILMVLVTILFGTLLFFKIKDKSITLNIVKKTLPKSLLLVAILVLVSYLFSNIVAFVGRVPFSLFYVRVSFGDSVASIFILLVLLVLMLKIKRSKDEVVIIGIGFNVLLTIVTTLILPGASFLFLVTAFAGLIVITSDYLNNKHLKHTLLFISYLLVLLLIVPITFSFYMALTVGGMAVLVLLIILSASVFIPAVLKQLELE